MRTNSLLIGAGITSFLIFAIVFVPASVITNRFTDSIRFGGVDGTLWNGHVSSLDVNGWQLHDTKWKLKPIALLLGRLSASVSTRIEGGEINADASVSVFGAISIHDLEAAGPIAPIAAKLNLLVSSGYYQVELIELKVTDAWPVSVVGSAQVTDVPLNITGGGAGPTGSYIVTFNAESVPEDGRLTGALADNGGPIEVDGNVVLTPPTNYVVQAKVKARPNASADISQALMLAGPVGPDGRREISLAGSL